MDSRTGRLRRCRADRRAPSNSSDRAAAAVLQAAVDCVIRPLREKSHRGIGKGKRCSRVSRTARGRNEHLLAGGIIHDGGRTEHHLFGGVMVRLAETPNLPSPAVDRYQVDYTDANTLYSSNCRLYLPFLSSRRVDSNAET